MEKVSHLPYSLATASTAWHSSGTGLSGLGARVAIIDAHGELEIPVEPIGRGLPRRDTPFRGRGLRERAAPGSGPSIVCRDRTPQPTP